MKWCAKLKTDGHIEDIWQETDWSSIGCGKAGEIEYNQKLKTLGIKSTNWKENGLLYGFLF